MMKTSFVPTCLLYSRQFRAVNAVISGNWLLFHRQYVTFVLFTITEDEEAMMKNAIDTQASSPYVVDETLILLSSGR